MNAKNEVRLSAMTQKQSNAEISESDQEQKNGAARKLF